MTRPVSVPRGRHAPPLAVRLQMQRERLLDAAARVFAANGFAAATAEAISREAGMSKATFYEHFDNKEDAIIALFDAFVEGLARRMAEATSEVLASPEAQMRAGAHAFLEGLAEHPERAQIMLVEIIGAGPRAVERRDVVLERFAALVDAENATVHRKFGTPRFASPHDAFAIVGAVVELCSRHVRLGVPESLQELEPVVERLALGVLYGPR